MKHYRHLTLEQRLSLYSCLKAEFSFVEAARVLGVHKSTIGRELARNGNLGEYRPDLAQRLVHQRRQNKAARSGQQDREHC